ncbi:trace amine-associated receptor 1-like [Hippoglossus stenolepis]|uniref:trace amine-associated receptor 1-like n=1 Tax=Hippoglossus stenolepis TaxID=195615 RepID=UPI001FAFACB6|nr:trace amine-associated receptor 1-like [Hippoglossus stenolepis]
MEMDISFNQSNVFTEIHPCYKIDLFHVLRSNPSAVCVLFHVFLGSLSVVTVCGNLLVIIAIIYFKQLHTPTNSLILSLAVADLLVGVVVFPLTIEFSITFCLFYDDLFYRYYAVCQPLSYKTKINDHVVVTMILVSWGLSVLIGLSFIIAGINHEKCTEMCITDVVLANIMGLIFSFYLPVVVMLCIYMKIFSVAQRQARSIHNTTCQSTKSRAAVSKMERKATKTLAIVMGVFLLCWLPFFLCTTVLSFSHVYVPLPLIELLSWLALSNSMLNPFIYAFFYSWFRSAFRMIISGKVIQGDFTNSKLH